MTDSIRRAIEMLRRLEAEATPGPWDFNSTVEIEYDVLLTLCARNQLSLALDVIEAVAQGRAPSAYAALQAWADHVNGEAE